jgi:putative transposase
MSDKYKINNIEGIYFVTLTVVDWVDVFTRKEHKERIIESLKFCQQNKGLDIYAWCLMSNHLHMIISARSGFNLSDILRDFKKFTSKQIVKAIQEEPESRRDWMLYRFEFAGKFLKRIKEYKFWQDGNMAKELITNEFIQQKLDYIHFNPVEALIVSEPEHYLFSSASNYAGGGGLIDVKFIE